MTLQITLSEDGPHSGDYSTNVADAISQGVRVLNHALRRGGIEQPADAAYIISDLALAAHGLEQLCDQFSSYFVTELAAGRLGLWSEREGTVETAVEETTLALGLSASLASQLGRQLDAARNLCDGLEGVGE